MRYKAANQVKVVLRLRVEVRWGTELADASKFFFSIEQGVRGQLSGGHVDQRALAGDKMGGGARPTFDGPGEYFAAGGAKEGIEVGSKEWRELRERIEAESVSSKSVSTFDSQLASL